jgi:glucose/mannose-6-phosphate isomerase
MVALDNLEIYRQYDPSGMLVHLYGLPQQCRQAWEKASKFALPTDFKDVNKMVICGMGGSAIGGDLLHGLTSNLSKPLVFVHRGYDLPAFVDSKTLVIASSYSGNTEETLSAFKQALNTNCKKLAVTTGGKLRNLAQEKQVTIFTIDYLSPPRAALGYSFIPLIALLSKLGFLEDKSAEVEGMAQTLEKLLGKLAEDIPIAHNPAKQLASKLFGKLVAIYGAGILSPVARRWKGEFNENSKAWAFYETFPELNHNTVVGYEFPKEMADKLYVILLRCPSLHPRILARYQITCEILQKAGVKHEIFDSQGENELTQMMSLLFLGDWTSYYLAMLNQTDPMPVKMIDYLKKRLSGTES